MSEITAERAGEAWRQAIAHILAHGRAFIDDNDRECRETSNLVINIDNPASAADGVHAMRASKRWRYPSEEELANIMLNKEAGATYDYLYGQRIFAYDGAFNQAEDYIIPLLRQRPNTRRAIISLLNPLRDLKLEAQNVVGVTAIHFRIIDGRLNATMVIRTSGLFTGWPANIYQLAKLQEHVCHGLSLPPGRLTTISLSAHLHTDTYDDMREVLGDELIARSAGS